MDADIHTLFESDFYRIMDFQCRCKDCGTSKPEYSRSFCISFVRTGNFLFNVFRHSLDSYTGCVLITKPGYERTVTHVQPVPDACTIFDFKEAFYQSVLEQFGSLAFFRNPDLHSTLVRTKPETEFLHAAVMQRINTKAFSKLEVDNLIMEVLDQVLRNISDYAPDLRIHARLKKNHLVTIERAKEYMTTHFDRDVSLMDLADHCYVSPFHFSRIFKLFTGCSPHQYLSDVRLKHAELRLRNTTEPVSDVAFASGFNSVEHFTAAFSRRYHCAPARFRNQQSRQLLNEQDF
jgi:AraC family transcriptional regulator